MAVRFRNGYMRMKEPSKYHERKIHVRKKIKCSSTFPDNVRTG